ncbi:hypothetical protein GCK72_023061 [Caenorhabditis remanei]|uniref:HMG box domain-containing protein n=1 Tax=Caenorhabditis remanei TaxID=31234 RepID=A0A6A5FVS4_CAERE|nr:hypothetical protein GCK72_023061 [Caenorhabditis remanei]KAF1746604.1 hypothetical protein GCK72_023061 [Caenorhabditis remanei]
MCALSPVICGKGRSHSNTLILDMEKIPEYVENPKTAYMLYCEAKRPHFIKNYPDLTNQELYQVLESLWKMDNSKEKIEYISEAARLKDIQKKYYGHIKKPMNAFKIWFSEKKAEFIDRDPTASPMLIMARLADHWKTMSKNRKLPYYEKERIQRKEHAAAVTRTKTDFHLKYNEKPENSKPRSAYLIFYTLKKADLLQNKTAIKSQSIPEELRRIWRNMSPEDKMPYKEKADALKREYEQRITSLDTHEGRGTTEIQDDELQFKISDNKDCIPLSYPSSPESMIFSDIEPNGGPSQSSAADYFENLVFFNDQSENLEDIKPTLKFSSDFPWELALKSIF